MKDHPKASQVFASPNTTDTSCEAITPTMLPLVELNQQQIDDVVRTVPGGADNVQDIYPLTPLQDGILFDCLFNEGSDAYTLSTLFECRSVELLELWIHAL